MPFFAAIGAALLLLLATMGTVLLGTKASAEETHILSGAVTLPEGAPAAWFGAIQVCAESNDAYNCAFDVDPETGHYAIYGLPAGEYRVQFSVGDYWDESEHAYVHANLMSEYYDDTRSWGSATLVEITSTDVSGVDAALESGTAISGTVSIPEDAPAEWWDAIQVCAESGVDGACDHTIDPATGAYEIVGLPAGEYWVRFEVDGYWDDAAGDFVYPNLVSEYYDDVAESWEGTTVDTSAGDVTGIDAALEYGRAIAGTVTLPDGAPSAWLDAVSVCAGGECVSVDPVTGDYEISGLAAGEYEVSFDVYSYWDDAEGRFVQPNLVSEYYDDARSWDDATPVDVSTADASGIDAQLSAGLAISGTVTLPAEATPDWFDALTVCAYHEDDSNCADYVDRETGEYQIDRLAGGFYVVEFLVGDYWDDEAGEWVTPNLVPEYYDDALSWSDATRVDLTSGDAGGIDATLVGGTSISGTVELPEGAPAVWLDALGVCATSGDVHRCESTFDRVTGDYSISGLPAGEYTVEFHVGWYWDESSDEDVRPNLIPEYFDDAVNPDDATMVDTTAGDATGISAVLDLGKSISGTVTLPEDAPAAWFDAVEVCADGATYECSDGVDPLTGAYEIKGLVPGDYAVGFWIGEYWDEAAGDYLKPNLLGEYYVDAVFYDDATMVEVAAADVSGIDATLAYGTTVSGQVTLPEDAPAAWAEAVQVCADGDDWGCAYGVDPVTGAYEITGLQPGTYKVSFSAGEYWDDEEGDWIVPNLVHKYFDDVATWDAATVVDVTSGPATGIDATLERGQTISGSVTLPDGAPVEWLDAVSVCSYDADAVESWPDCTYTVNGSGEYVLSQLPAGHYIVEFNVGSYWDGDIDDEVFPNLAGEYYDDVQSRDDATVLDLTSGSAAGVDATLAYGTTISGTVAIPEDAPARWFESLGVCAYLDGVLEACTWDVSADTGAYEIDGLAAAAYDVRFVVSSYWDDEAGRSVQPNLVPEYYGDTYFSEEATPVDVSAESATGIDALLGYGRTISGTIDLPDGVEEMRAGSLIVCAVGAVDAEWCDYDVDPITGEYEITGLAPGTYTVSFYDPYGCECGWDGLPPASLVFSYYDGATSAGSATPVDVTAGDATGIDAVLDPEEETVEPPVVEPPVVQPPSVVFPDVPKSSVFYTHISWLANEGITSGYANGSFGPTDPVTRGQMAAFLYKMAGSPAWTPPAKSPFTDVSTSNVFYKHITWLANEGITSGVGDGTRFAPNSEVTRGQMAAFLYKMAGSPSYSPPSSASFPDVPRSHTFFKHIEWLAESGITNGYGSGLFGPSDQVTRGQMAAFLYKFDRLPV
ncbi:S-layer homology domain-containing protein [Demequina zhanjiangensis]|uniref:S-layer homology domain-containing protein n=1 Tax=Demequina zhanjiangensis TaxID=3051659 RepID=A0ABT8G4B8_9MICO|nr:S-layer homology domain-containing protein [Demequina sp. SYSU T00b26]MDN4473970.1 S-layer homology domain-containing protein [Demequina sp. SYSU T00b26]